MSRLIKGTNSLAFIKEKTEEKLNIYFPAGVPDFARKRYEQETASKFSIKEWNQMVNEYSFPEEFVDCCQKYQYLYRRGDVLVRLRLLAMCIR